MNWKPPHSRLIQQLCKGECHGWQICFSSQKCRFYCTLESSTVCFSLSGWALHILCRGCRSSMSRVKTREREKIKELARSGVLLPNCTVEIRKKSQRRRVPPLPSQIRCLTSVPPPPELSGRFPSNRLKLYYLCCLYFLKRTGFFTDLVRSWIEMCGFTDY